MVIVPELVSGRIFYYDPSMVLGGQAVLQELELSYNGADTTLSALEGNPYAGGRVDLRMGQDADGELYLLSKTYGDIYRLLSLSPVPEPASWAMMALGLGLVGSAMRRRPRMSGFRPSAAG
ncbi:PEPxxWA-CTERM sorting domain-containing protein [Sphingomonas nostoxanthinifaciens]|nr:PEPxxWA-CTERM sorting domain-containing protein [Sphingomonas nostoxanthinifaciens]